MEIEIAAKVMKELGHPTRLAIYKRLVKSGYPGLAVGVVQEDLDIPGSTLSHHLSRLTAAGLIEQRREGRVLFCVVKYAQLEAVISFLQDECCADADAQQSA
ncbi:MAG: ArsR/SmtB family transcription factor [Woeseiales bacterium]